MKLSGVILPVAIFLVVIMEMEMVDAACDPMNCAMTGGMCNPTTGACATSQGGGPPPPQVGQAGQPPQCDSMTCAMNGGMCISGNCQPSQGGGPPLGQAPQCPANCPAGTSCQDGTCQAEERQNNGFPPFLTKLYNAIGRAKAGFRRGNRNQG